MNRIIACLAAALATIVVASAVADDDLATEFETYQAVEEKSDRLACYDELAASMAPSASEKTAALILDDNVAKTEVKGANVEEPVYAATVTRCVQSKQEKRLISSWRMARSGNRATQSGCASKIRTAGST